MKTVTSMLFKDLSKLW